MRRIFYILFILFLTTIFSEKSILVNNVKAQARVRAPELTGGKSWLNTDKPLSLAGLKGKVVLLDFWTYGCINCIHIIPDLKKLEAKYPNNLVVIGVHSAKFVNESETENIRKIILRYGLEHPVINDAEMKIWDAYAIRAWPTQVLIDPTGYIVGQISGEGNYDVLDEAIGKTIEEFRKKGELNEQPLNLTLERAKVGDLPLAFPGKILADEKSNRLFIADSNHNRIVITDLNGKFIEAIGNGTAALKDGNYQTVSFNRPQGLALDGETLYVADTENHAIRQVNLQTKQVETIAGNGKQAAYRAVGGNAKTSEISSPWDVAKVGNALYIAMAGTHQIWKLDFDTQIVAPFAGSGAEARRDGSLAESAFAQSSGLVSDGKHLFVADSESNIIREIDLQKQTVKTLVGGDLFEFGDKDGAGDDVRLQHPLGVTLYNGKVLIADTYNHKIKQLDTVNRTVKTFSGTGKSGQIDGAMSQFYEPGGISIAGGKLYVADTNNHAVRVVNLNTKQVSTLKIEGLKPPVEVQNVAETVSPNAKEITTEIKEISINLPTSLNFQINLPKDFHLNPDAPNRYEISVEDGKNITFANAKQKFGQLPLAIPIQVNQAGTTTLKAKITVYYCREDNTGTCLIKTLIWKIPLKVIDDNKLTNKVDLIGNVE